MIHIDFEPQRLTGEQKVWWDNWQGKAAEETQEIIQTWEESKKLSSNDFNDSIWGELKRWLLENVFHGKCAYCETHIEMARQHGDAEHFRPKGGVNYKKPGNTRLTKATGEDESGQLIEHPGYFWLAYHWKNLLPACRFCNSGNSKKNQFPVQKQHVLLKCLTQEAANALSGKPRQSSTWQNIYYLQPVDLNDLEEPLLLHPHIDEPSEHICFGHAGVESAKSIKGTHSIEVYDLKNDELRRARHNAQIQAWNKFIIAYNHYTMQGHRPVECRQKAWEDLSDITAGKTPYSAAATDFINLHCQTLGGR